MPKFTSKYASLTLQDAKGVWARFSDGEFETDDKALVARLRKADYVTEVEAEKVADADDAGDAKKD